MIVSLIIVLLSFGGVEIQEVGALGTKLVFGNKDVLYIGLWVIFFYFLFRYYQYFLEEDDRGIAEAFWAKVNALSFNVLRKAAAVQHSLQLNQLAGEFRFSQLQKKSQFIRTGTVVTSRGQYGEQMSSEYKINTLKYTPAFVLAVAHVAVNRSVLTDFLLPFLVAIAALIAGFSGSWEGSLCKVVEWHTFQRLCSP
ncbi:MAG TPA: hypothetical protein VK138_07510 [Acidiferrobacterales bacterium]|nr:hypothetical protein [Acidiferrobacterales bacterium]